MVQSIMQKAYLAVLLFLDAGLLLKELGLLCEDSWGEILLEFPESMYDRRKTHRSEATVASVLLWGLLPLREPIRHAFQRQLTVMLHAESLGRSSKTGEFDLSVSLDLNRQQWMSHYLRLLCAGRDASETLFELAFSELVRPFSAAHVESRRLGRLLQRIPEKFRQRLATQPADVISVFERSWPRLSPSYSIRRGKSSSSSSQAPATLSGPATKRAMMLLHGTSSLASLP
jgi:hypothetical protein